MRQQERKQLTEEQARISVLMSEKQELEEKLVMFSRKASGITYKSFLVFLDSFANCTFSICVDCSHADCLSISFSFLLVSPVVAIAKVVPQTLRLIDPLTC